jgi:hypothetical protein
MFISLVEVSGKEITTVAVEGLPREPCEGFEMVTLKLRSSLGVASGINEIEMLPEVALPGTVIVPVLAL